MLLLTLFVSLWLRGAGSTDSNDPVQIEDDGVSSKVDVVLAPGCAADNLLLRSHLREAHRREADHERSLSFTLKMIQKNADWVHKIYILQDPACEDTWQAKLHSGEIPQPEKTIWMNRCSLFPHPSHEHKAMIEFRKEQDVLKEMSSDFPGLTVHPKARMNVEARQSQHADEGPACPTRNAFSVQTVIHKIPGLSERFLLVNSGDLVMKPTSISTFFDGRKPRYPAGRAWRLYENQTVATRLRAQVPLTIGRERRVWTPLTKRLTTRVAARFPKWASFVRSHREGRYASSLNECGTPESEKEDSREESLQGVWWWYLNSHPHLGTKHSGSLFEEHIATPQFDSLVASPSVTIVSMENTIDHLEGGAEDEHSLRLRRQARKKLEGMLEAQVGSGIRVGAQGEVEALHDDPHEATPALSLAEGGERVGEAMLASSRKSRIMRTAEKGMLPFAAY